MTLYRPVGDDELRLIEASGWKRVPPRLAERPIFYPVCNRRYAEEIVGAGYHQEYWIPAVDLEGFNDAIEDVIRLLATFGE